MAIDHYELLGVTPSARHPEIRAAYRRLMREHHPDLRPGDPGAEEMSRRLTAAWTVLGRPTARAAYDRTRLAARQGAPSSQDLASAPVAGAAGSRDTTGAAPAYSSCVPFRGASRAERTTIGPAHHSCNRGNPPWQSTSPPT